MDNDLLLNPQRLLKLYKRLIPVAHRLLTFNLSVVNEVFSFKASQRSRNQ